MHRTSRTATATAAVVLTTALALPSFAGSKAARPRTGGLRFGSPIQVEAHNPIGSLLGNGERQPSGEPSIKVDSSGVVYIAGVTSVGQASPVWVSMDGGRSFSELTTPLNWRERSPYGAEGDIAIDSMDRMYFVDTAIPTLAFSRWSPPAPPNDTPQWDFTLPHTLGVVPGFDDRPWLAYGGSGPDDESFWLYVNHVSHVTVYKSEDQGTTWETSTTTLGEGQRFFTGMVASPHDDSQTAYLFGNCGDDVSLCSRDTHDGGTTWRETVVAEVDEGREIGPIMVANAVDDAGNTYGVWPEAGDGCDVFYAASRDGGATWLPKVRVGGPGCSAFPWITAGSGGRIGIAWYETAAETDHPDDAPDDAEWFLRAAVVTNAASTSPTITATVADPQPVHIGPLLRRLWDYLQVTTGPDGRVHIAYAEDVRAGHDGPVGTGINPSNGTNAKDTIYVVQTGGPSLRR